MLTCIIWNYSLNRWKCAKFNNRTISFKLCVHDIQLVPILRGASQKVYATVSFLLMISTWYLKWCIQEFGDLQIFKLHHLNGTLPPFQLYNILISTCLSQCCFVDVTHGC